MALKRQSKPDRPSVHNPRLYQPGELLDASGTRCDCYHADHGDRVEFVRYHASLIDADVTTCGITLTVPLDTLSRPAWRDPRRTPDTRH